MIPITVPYSFVMNDYRQHKRGMFRSFQAFVSRKLCSSKRTISEVVYTIFYLFMTCFIWTLELWNEVEVAW